MSTHAAAPASAYATYRTWGLRALRNDATSAGGRGSAWGERVRDEAGRETRARVVGAARAWETRARNASRRSRDHDVDMYRPCRRSARWRARRLRSRIGRWRARPNHPKSGCGYTPSGSCEGATDSGEDRGNTYRRRPRRAKVAWLPPRTPSSSSRVSAMDRCVRVWRTHERARGRDELPSFFPGKCNRLVLHQKLQNNGSLVDKKCEIGLKINSSCTV